MAGTVNAYQELELLEMNYTDIQINFVKKKSKIVAYWALCIRRTRTDADGRGHFIFI